MLSIRKAAASELPQIQTLAREVIAARYPAFLGQEAVAGYLDSGQADAEISEHADQLFVALDGETLVGFTICFDDFVHVMMTRLDCQRGGYGSHILKWCESEIAGHGHSTGRLETFVANEQAVGFYIKNGWHEVKRDGPEAGEFARIWFEKPL